MPRGTYEHFHVSVGREHSGLSDKLKSAAVKDGQISYSKWVCNLIASRMKRLGIKMASRKKSR